MLHFRSFRNTDPPAVAALWRSRAGEKGFLQPVSVDLFEQYVFAKPYFDPEGLILAFDDDRPIGFTHAGFGPNQTGSRLARDSGVVCALVVRAEASAGEAAAGLLDRCETYLIDRGAKVLWGGSFAPLAPFYFGLYGGCEPPGVLESDSIAAHLYPSRGYEATRQTLLMRGRLDTFRPPVDRQQAQLRRRMLVQAVVDPPTATWWEACVAGEFDRTRFQAVARGNPKALAGATFRAMDLTEPGLPGRTGGLLDLVVDPALRRQGLATFLLGEAFRSLAEQGLSVVEAVATADNAAALGLLEKLRFDRVGRGVVYRKSVG
jgi:ribosomal protein S18 acetylase RimI-like enzyme